jgi:hypothetical protein
MYSNSTGARLWTRRLPGRFLFAAFAHPEEADGFFRQFFGREQSNPPTPLPCQSSGSTISGARPKSKCGFAFGSPIALPCKTADKKG